MFLNLVALVVFFCGIMSLSIAGYAWKQRSTRGAGVFALFMFALSIYILGYGFELSVTNIQSMLFWSKIQYIGILTAPTIYLVFTIHYIGRQNWLTPRIIILLFLLPALLLAAKFMDDRLHLIYTAAAIDSSGLVPLLTFTRGPLYLLVVAYNLLMVTTGNILLLRRRKYGSTLFRRQTSILLVFALIIYIVYGMYQLGITPIPSLKHLDLNPFVYTVWGLGISIGIFRYNLFDLEPIARDALIEMLSDGVVVLDSQSRFVDANPEAQKIFGWDVLPVGKPAEMLMNQWFDSTSLQSLENPLKSEVQLKQNGTDLTYEITTKPLQDKNRERLGYLILVHDITERKEVENKLHELSLVDDLTGLTNRRGLNMLALQLLGMANRMKLNAALAYIDLDGLKIINDTLGHATGDRALQEMASLLRTTFRTADIITRLGGDEFVVLAIEQADNPNESISLRLQNNLRALNALPERTYQLSFSIGLSRYKWDHPVTLSTLLEEADQAMYIQKQSKRNGTPT